MEIRNILKELKPKPQTTIEIKSLEHQKMAEAQLLSNIY